MRRILIALMVVTVMVSSVMPISTLATTDEPQTTTESAVVETEPTTAENQTEEANPYLIEYEGKQYIVPPLSLNRESSVTESGYVEAYTEVPQYFQTYYPKLMYGNTSVRRGGCGITCVSMVLTYLLDEEVGIEELVQKYYRYKVQEGSSYNLFYDSAEDYGVTVTTKPVYDWKTVKKALENGQVVIANPRSQSIFTEGGHFIVLAGLTEEGKIVVRDPNLYNYSIWNYPVREEGYANGFEEKNIMYSCLPCWIYQKKDLEAVAARAEQAEEDNFSTIETEP